VCFRIEDIMVNILFMRHALGKSHWHFDAFDTFFDHSLRSARLPYVLYYCTDENGAGRDGRGQTRIEPEDPRRCIPNGNARSKSKQAVFDSLRKLE
jgi:hypothetical protein